ncbi:hypothetical protein ACIF6L_14430 [Kitasatospora sp. NPDC086009]|uniref:hypothetical protein n=1 Tax=unclassified Kitasatospora TaxID=2633591 RepID=UPI0037CB40EB
MPRTTEHLPHDPYLDAVIRAVREAGYDTGPHRSTDYVTDDGEAMLREAFIDLGEDDQDDEDEPVRTALARRQITGWLGSDYDGHGRHGRHEHADEAFADDGALPAPPPSPTSSVPGSTGPRVSPTPGGRRHHAIRWPAARHARHGPGERRRHRGPRPPARYLRVSGLTTRLSGGPTHPPPRRPPRPRPPGPARVGTS